MVLGDAVMSRLSRVLAIQLLCVEQERVIESRPTGIRRLSLSRALIDLLTGCICSTALIALSSVSAYAFALWRFSF